MRSRAGPGHVDDVCGDALLSELLRCSQHLRQHRTAAHEIHQLHVAPAGTVAEQLRVRLEGVDQSVGARDDLPAQHRLG
jgi:hypothetical protein